MEISRRAVMLGAAASVGMGVPRGAVHAALRLGDSRIDVVSDGFLTLPGGFLFDPMPRDALLPILERHGQSPDQLTPPCNVTLLRRDGRTVLFDLGAGPDFSPDSGQLLDALAALDVAPEEVTDVVFTHAHPDHLWGLLDDFDDLLFYDARFMIGRAEWAYWMNPNTLHEIGEARASFAVGAQRRLERLADRITLFDDGDEVLPGVGARASFGHTPGHMAFEVHDGSQALMILGDSIGNHHVAFERPEWPSGSDHDRDAAAQTRLSLLDQLAAEKMRVVGYHLPGAGLGHVERAGGHYRFVPEGA